MKTNNKWLQVMIKVSNKIKIKLMVGMGHQSYLKSKT